MPDNKVTRQWYVMQLSSIDDQIDAMLPLEERARQAWCLRNTSKRKARELMDDLDERQRLNEEKPPSDFEQLVADKMRRKGLTREQALQDIIETASKPNPRVNKQFGL